MAQTKFSIGVLGFVLLISGSVIAQAPAVEVNEADTSIDISQLKLNERPLPARAKECEFCHTKKSRDFYKKGVAPQSEHETITPLHGKRVISCNSCHDINNHNYLRTSKENPASFANSSPVCASCHMEKFRDWSKGLHGKRLGGWRQPKVQLNCIDCHKPHSVSFPKMESVAKPPQSPYVIPKTDESKGEH